MISKLDLVNKHGARLCDAFGCRKHKRLTVCYGGYFCKGHRQELDNIRINVNYYKLLQSKSPGEIQSEISYRLDEQLLRKRMHLQHMEYILKLGYELAAVS